MKYLSLISQFAVYSNFLSLVTAFLLIGCNAKVQTQNPNQLPSDQAKVIYGEDGRHEVNEVSAAQQLLAQSAIAIVDKYKIQDQENGYSLLNGKTFGDTVGLCPTERFIDQILAAECSASLIGEDIVLTAGHCANDYYCEYYSFVFGYFGKDSAGRNLVKTDDVYNCKEVIYSEKTSNGPDFGLIRLDRKVKDHKPLAIRTEGDINIGEEVFVIGNPVGLPTKVTTGGKVRSRGNGFFVTNLDTFSGNSGSPVFNAKTNLIEGILVRGESDFSYGDGCRVMHRCGEDECRGEDVTDVKLILKYLDAKK